MARLIKSDYDPLTGFTEEFWYEEPVILGGPGRVTIRRLQDVEGTLALNREQLNMAPKGYSDVKEGLYHKARIPLVKVEQWMREGFNWFEASDNEKRAKLNERDNSKLLVRSGKI
jgi:hypothetical protein